MATVLKGNVREIPGGMPPLAWHEKVLEYERDEAGLARLGWYDQVMEYLSPEELRRFRAKVRIWVEITGAWPDDLSCWWEVRQARKRGDVPMPHGAALGIVEDDVLRCGKCGARWSDRPERCGLCGVWIVLEEALA